MPGPNSIDPSRANRFWQPPEIPQPPAPPIDLGVPPPVPPPEAVPDVAVAAFADRGGDGMARPAPNGADVFAAAHVLDGDGREPEAVQAGENTVRLLGAEGAKAFLDEVSAAYAELAGDEDSREIRDLCRTALLKMMATRELRQRAQLRNPVPGPHGEVSYRKLDGDGRAELKEQVLGLADMIRTRKISEKAELVCANGKYYDASDSADLLRLAEDSAERAKTLFLGRERFETLIAQCQKALDVRGDLSPAERAVFQREIERLKAAADEAVRLRTDAAKGIGTDAAPAGKAADDREVQALQLDRIRESLRAFREDIDLARGAGEAGGAGRIGPDAYRAIKAADKAFNDLLEAFRGKCAAPEGSPWDGRADADADAEAASRLAHLTCDRIRYHRDGGDGQFRLGSTVSGFRVPRDGADRPSYGGKLRDRNVPEGTADVLLRKRNAGIAGERAEWPLGPGGGMDFRQV